MVSRGDSSTDDISLPQILRDLDYKAFLAQSLQSEWQGRHHKGVQSRLTQARFPSIKTLEQYDLNFQPSLDRKVIRELGQFWTSTFCDVNSVYLKEPAWANKTPQNDNSGHPNFVV